jgi:uncharacterized protein YifN (PemK superfamily)
VLQYQPKEGAIVKCDFSGYIIPEIVKKRPVIVISAHKANAKLVTVVPLSATPPTKIEYYHLELDLSVEKNIEPYLSNCKRWFKCDLVYVVSIERMDRYKNRFTGKRDTPQVSIRTLRVVKEMVRLANGL